MATDSSPSDWPEKCAKLREMDNLLRCSICFEFLSTTMLVPECSHNFCSLCIRRFLVYKSQCPTCSTPVTEPELKNNRALDDLVSCFVSIRVELINIMKRERSPDSSPKMEQNLVKEKEKNLSSETREDMSTVPGVTEEPETVMINDLASIFSGNKSPPGGSGGAKKQGPVKPMSTQKRKVKSSYFTSNKKENRKPSPSIKQAFQNQQRGYVDDNSDSDLFIVDEEDESSDDDFVEMKNTPSVSKRTSDIKTNQVVRNIPVPAVDTLNDRNDICTSPVKQSEASQSSEIILQTPDISKKVPCPVCGVPVAERYVNQHLDRCLSSSEKKESLRSAAPKRKTLPKLVYNLMSDKDIKKKLKEVGLSCQGNRQNLIKRHHEFTLQYNSECDKLNPKSGAQIVKEMEKLDQVKGRLAGSGRQKESVLSILNKNTAPEKVDMAQKEYVKQHKSQYDRLIEETRKRMQKKKASKTPTQADENEQNTEKGDSRCDVCVIEESDGESVDIATDNSDSKCKRGRDTDDNMAQQAEISSSTNIDEDINRSTQENINSYINAETEQSNWSDCPASRDTGASNSVVSHVIVHEESSHDMAEQTSGQCDPSWPVEVATEAEEGPPHIVQITVDTHTGQLDMITVGSEDELYGHFDMETPDKLKVVSSDKVHEVNTDGDELDKTSPIQLDPARSSEDVNSGLSESPSNVFKSPTVSRTDVIKSLPDNSPVFSKSTPLGKTRDINFGLKFDSPSSPQPSSSHKVNSSSVKNRVRQRRSSKKSNKNENLSKCEDRDGIDNVSQSGHLRENLERSYIDGSESEGETGDSIDMMSQLSQHIEKFESNQGPDRIKNALVEESPWLLKTTYVEQESREIATGVNAEQNEDQKKSKKKRRKLIMDDSSDIGSVEDEVWQMFPLSPEPVQQRRSLRKRKTTESYNESQSQETKKKTKRKR